MSDVQKDSIEIDLFDLVIYILKKIVVILVVACVFSVAGASYAFVKNHFSEGTVVTNVLNLDNRLPGETDDEYYDRITQVSQAFNVMRSIDSLSRQVDRQNAYLSNSILMQIDPSNVPISEAQIVVQLCDDSNVGSLDALYTAYKHDILSGDYLLSLSDCLECGPESLGELISISRGIEDNDAFVHVDNNEYRVLVFNIQVAGISTEFSDILLNGILDELLVKATDFSNTIVNHSITVVGRQSLITNSNEIRTSQYNAAVSINTLENQINSQNSILDNLAKQLKIGDRSSFYNPASAEKQSSSIKSITKCSLIGLLLGICVAVAWYVICYIFGKRIVSQRQFFCMFGFLECVGVCKPLKIASRYNNLLNRLSGDDNEYSVQTTNSIVLANYLNLVHDCKNVLITGSIDNATVRKSIEDLKLCGDVRLNLFDNPDILSKASNYDGLVIIEQRGVSKKRVVRNELKLLSASGTRIVGSIVI